MFVITIIQKNVLFQAHTNVLLAFSMQGSGAFQGLARIASKSAKNNPKLDWTIPPHMADDALSAVFQIDWLSQ